MKWILIAALLLSGCTIQILPIKKQPAKKQKTRAHHSTPARKAAQVPVANVREGWWVENYHKLEEAHGDYTIPDDANIEPLPDGRFKVPDAVLRHNQDLSLVKPSPKP